MIAVTGAAGFIGSNLAHRLAADGTDLLLVDHELTPPKAANLAGLARFRFLRHDAFLDDLDTGRVEPEVVFHLGACSSTTETDWDYLSRNNVAYTQHLWQWCVRHDKPLIYASSAATYGDGSLGFDDRVAPDRLAPLNLYGRSKNDFDRWALDLADRGEPCPPTWAGLKFFNVYGPRESHKGGMASVVWQAHRQILASGVMKLFRSNDPAIADGGQRRDFVFVGDCVDQAIWLARNPHPGGLYNSGSGSARTFLELTEAVFAALGLAPRIEFVPMPERLAGHYQNYTCARLDRLREAGYSAPPTPFEAGVARTVGWLEARALDKKSLPDR